MHPVTTYHGEPSFLSQDSLTSMSMTIYKAGFPDQLIQCNTLAGRAKRLESLPADIANAQKGLKTKTLAILACIATALLIVLVIASLPLCICICPKIVNEGTGLLWALLLMVSVALCVKTFDYTISVFKAPDLTKLKQEQADHQQKINESNPKILYQHMEKVEKEIEDKLTQAREGLLLSYIPCSPSDYKDWTSRFQKVHQEIVALKNYMQSLSKDR